MKPHPKRAFVRAFGTAHPLSAVENPCKSDGPGQDSNLRPRDLKVRLDYKSRDSPLQRTAATGTCGDNPVRTLYAHFFGFTDNEAETGRTRQEALIRAGTHRIRSPRGFSTRPTCPCASPPIAMRQAWSIEHLRERKNARELGARSNAELDVNVVQVRLDRFGADEKCRARFLVRRSATDDQRKL